MNRDEGFPAAPVGLAPPVCGQSEAAAISTVGLRDFHILASLTDVERERIELEFLENPPEPDYGDDF